jgi:hypothetical protein
MKVDILEVASLSHEESELGAALLNLMMMERETI